MGTCFCMGPQNSEPLCPCQMRAMGVFKRDGEWILPAKEEEVLGTVKDKDVFTAESNYEVIKEVYRHKKCTGNCDKC